MANTLHTNLSTMSREQLEALVTVMAAASERRISLKVGLSGTLCVYHGSKYPIALYRSQWERLLPFFRSEAIPDFIAANAALLADSKSAKPAA